MILQFSSTTGAWQFSKCDQSPPILVTGTGTVSHANGCFSLLVASGGNRISANFTNGCTTGSASATIQIVQGVYQTFSLHDSNINNNTCSSTPAVSLTAPIGGEILDSGSMFTINWSASDSVGISSQDVLYSVDGGSTYSVIATGLAPGVNQYNWLVPSLANTQNVKVRVVEHDASCNGASGDSPSTFTIWNPGQNFTHLAEASFFVSGQLFSSTIFLTNTSSSAVTAELDPHKPTGNATQNLPLQLALAAGASVSVDAASLYTIGASPQNSSFTDVISGGVRLRHNGPDDNTVRAVIVSEESGAQKFTTQFTYPASSQSTSGTMLCSPMYYVDSNNDGLVSFQNATNSPQTVELTCNYGTGAAGTPNGQFHAQPISLGPQQNYVMRLSSVAAMLGGTDWGSMDVYTTAPQSVVCHSVMTSSQSGVAWDCPFIDPSMALSTTKVANTVMLDYDNSENGYIMVCNMSSSSRTLTASFNTSNGITISPVQVSVAPNSQQMITLNAQQLLSPGQTTTADARLTYSGSATDIAAAGCSMSNSLDRAVPVKFKEPTAADGQELTSPFFRFDDTTSGTLQVSNLGTTDIMAGARMTFANSTTNALKSGLVTVPAGGTATLDLSNSGDGVPDTVDPIGRVDLIHNGAAGTVTAAITALGKLNKSGHVLPLDGGPPADPVTLFPAQSVITPGGYIKFDVIVHPSCVPELTLPDCGLSLGPMTPIGPRVFERTYQHTTCLSRHLSVFVGCSGFGDGSDLITPEFNFGGFSTSLPNNRLNPDGTTTFTLTAANGNLPAGPLQVSFNRGANSVAVQYQSDGTSPTINTHGPVNHTFLGGVKSVTVTDNTGALIIKAKKSGAYFALDPPATITAPSPSSVSVNGAQGVQIKGSGFKTWPIGGQTAFPTVLIGRDNQHDQIPFAVTSVPDASTIIGNVGPTPFGVGFCASGVSCKDVTVINPGGSDGNDSLTAGPILGLTSLAPIVTGANAITVAGQSGPAVSNSIGMQNIRVSGGYTAATPVTARILGTNLGRVVSVTFGNQEVMVGAGNHVSDGEIDVGVPAYCISGGPGTFGATPVNILVTDGVNPVSTLMNGWTYQPTGPIQFFAPNVPISVVAFLVGSCESVSVTPAGAGPLFTATDCSLRVAACVTIGNIRTTQRSIASTVFPGANIAFYQWDTDCSSCSLSGNKYTGVFTITATNTSSTNSTSLCESTSCIKQ
jgi:hypothetical protein